MASKHVVVPQKNQPVKKKKHGCCGCLVGILVFVLVINIAAFFTADYFAKKYINMSAMDCMKVLWDVRNVNEKKIVTNKYSPEQDLAAFKSELKEQLFLNDDVEISLDELVNSVIPGGDTVKQGVKHDNSLTKTIHLLNSAGVDETQSGLLGFISGLFKSENMNVERLNGYDENKHDTDYVFELTDKEFAALINDSLDEILKSQQDAINGIIGGIADISSIIRVDQVIFDKVDGIINGVSQQVPALTFTLSIDVRSIAATVVKQQTGTDLSILTNMMLPKRLYFTGKVGLNPAADVINHPLFINNMNEDGMTRVYNLVKGITKLTGTEVDLQKTINDSIDGFMKKIDNVLTQIISNDFSEHVFKVDLFDTLITVSGLNDGKEEADCLTAPDIIKTLGGIIASDADAAINKEHAWDNQYYDSATDKVVYKAAESSTTKLVDYKAEFMNEIALKYMLNLDGADKTPNTEDDVTFEDIMALFGIGTVDSAKELELLDLLDPSKLNSIVEQSERKVNINDRMMGAILNSQINTLIGDGSIKDMKPTLEYVILTSDELPAYTSKGIHNFVEMGLSVDVAGLLGDAAGGFGSIISGLIGEKIVLVIKLDVTPITEGTEFIYEPTIIKYNNLSKESTDIILKTINKLGISFDVDSLLNQVEKPVRDAISQMGSILPIKLCNSSINFDETYNNLPPAIELPSVFETIDTMLFKDDKDDIINADGIENVLTAIDAVNKEGFEDGYVLNRKADNYDGFLNQIQSKYYLAEQKDADGNPVQLTFDMLFGADSILNFSKFDTKNFNFETDENGLFHDKREVAELKPVFYDNQLAAMLYSKMQGDESLGDLVNIQELSVDSARGLLTLIIKLDLVKLMGEANSDKLALMPAETIFLKATIDTKTINYYNKATGESFTEPTENAVPYYVTKLNVNNMLEEEGTFNVLKAMINHLNGGSAALDLDLKAMEIGDLVYAQLKTLCDSLGLESVKFVEVTDPVTQKVEKGIELISFYDFLKIALKDTVPELETEDNDKIKSALQGLKAYNEDMPNDNNYKATEIVYNTAFTADTVDATHFIAGGFTPPNIITPFYATDRYLGTVLGGVGSTNFTLKQVNIFPTSLQVTYYMRGFAVGEGKMAGILPEEMYVTIIVPYNSVTKSFDDATFKINSLSDAEQSILLNIAGVEQSAINAQLIEVTNALDRFPNAELYANGDESIPESFKGKDFVGFIKYTLTH